ncbi:hypothetical protein BROUX41_005601 [Berkeleyomyces rouxiae]|uniref:uncharacterized protein n=1 Tax=Berkeleyomyces rouxiae TaxID=2035830 RepID=UPI003B7DD138
MDPITSDHQMPQAQNYSIPPYQTQTQLQSPFQPQSQTRHQSVSSVASEPVTSAPLEHQLELDRQMVRHLLSKYSKEELARIFQEETRKPIKPDQSDRSSLLSSRTASTTISDQSSVFDSSSSIRSFSDASSISGASIFSSVSSRILGRKSSHALSSKSQSQISLADATTSSSSKQKTTFVCGFCSEEDIVKTCTRKNDLKRHMEDFHNMNAQWHCRHRGCQMVFDWQTAYKAHLKQCHGGSRMSLDEAKVNLCPQVVFACGFSRCTQVFEASGDMDASNLFKEYVSHVVKHFDDGIQSSGQWSYDTRMRNLLRQHQVAQYWENYVSSDQNHEDAQLHWSPTTSLVLRKRLECRHIGDVAMTVHYALQLGTNHETPLKTHQDFIMPLKDSCTMAIPGHINNATSAASLQDIPPSFNFRIPRGPNPTLASYIASQRRATPMQSSRRSQRAQHYSSRSAGVNPSLASSSPSAGFSNSQYYSTHDISVSREPSLYDNRAESVYACGRDHLMPQVGGIISDDIQNLCTLTNSSPDSGDISMTDAEMLAQEFHHNYGGIPPNDMGPSAALSHHGQFFNDPTQTQY